MTTLNKLIGLVSIFFFFAGTAFSQRASKVSLPASRPLFSNELWWMIGAIVVLLLVIIFMPKNVKRITRYYRDADGNVKSVTQTIIRGKKVQPD